MATEDSDTAGVKSGDLGGFISKKENLDEEGQAWVFDDSVVLGDSLITGNALIKDGAVVTNTTVGLNSMISSVPVSDVVLHNEVRIYGKPLSIVIADPNLKYRSITATKFQIPGSDQISIAYSTFLGNADAFRKFIDSGSVTEGDKELFDKYLPLIQSRFEQ